MADAAAIDVFADNVGKLLLSAPFGPNAVLGVDPGIAPAASSPSSMSRGTTSARGSCTSRRPRARRRRPRCWRELVKKGDIRAVAVGNGTAGRETETFVREALRHFEIDVPVVMVNEAGASVYSASDAAREEFPELDVTVRGAISIARRLQDPLAELVKIDPKSIGVGQYQHDVSPTRLKKSLDDVVDSCVNQVGVNLNTASYHLLDHVSGIGPGLARAIVEHRAKAGLFKSRQALLEVPRFSKKTFEQAAGFLRIPDAPSRSTTPASIPSATRRSSARRRSSAFRRRTFSGPASKLVKQSASLKSELGTFTFDDVVRELEKPGRDPRETFVPFSFRDDIHELKDLKPGMVCPGIVTNVTNFGAFMDIGVHQDGLVHVSQLADQFVKVPKDVVSAGDRVTVRVLEVKLDKKQIRAHDEERTHRRRPHRRPAPGHRPQSGSKSLRSGPGPSTAGPLEAGHALQQPVGGGAGQQTSPALNRLHASNVT